MNQKLKTRNIIIAVIFFLISLIIIQFIWILRAAENQKKQFEFTVVQAINKATTELGKQEKACLLISNEFEKTCLTSCGKKHLSFEKWNFIDSIIKAELSYSKICINYELKLSSKPHPHEIDDEKESEHKCFTVKSDMVTTKGESIWLHINFPGSEKFVLAQMGWLFIASIILIILTIGAFILIYKYYLQEQILANDTRNFINNLTHEFKTPLASIRLANNRIMKLADCGDKAFAYTKIIHQENDKLDEHINYLLDLSRLQKGKVPMNFEVLDIHDLVKKQTLSFQLRVEDRNGSLTHNLTADKIIVNADCFHLANAFSNILDNACKYSPAAPKISISSYNKNDSVVIAFSDKGIGIDKNDQKNIFQEFSRVNTGNIHNIKGFGLGLSYVWQVVNLHKGNLWIESKKGEGSTFFIQLPTVKNSY
ncbi:MAG: HAMP domain-containing histidine kinase [Salinivirgaceae bacterium]|nr:HAMP domain-containing histidine kinase [Salinivirgaceae bacterium]